MAAVSDEGEKLSVTPTTGTDARARVELLERICARIRAGSSMDAACWREGIDPQAVRSTMRRHESVRTAVEAARAVAEDARRERMDAMIDDGKPTRGLEWQLQRLHPHVYDAPTKVELTGADGGPLTSQTVEPTEEALRARLEAIRAKLGT
jgi:hypothetical protein